MRIQNSINKVQTRFRGKKTFKNSSSTGKKKGGLHSAIVLEPALQLWSTQGPRDIVEENARSEAPKKWSGLISRPSRSFCLKNTCYLVLQDFSKMIRLKGMFEKTQRPKQILDQLGWFFKASMSWRGQSFHYRGQPIVPHRFPKDFERGQVVTSGSWHHPHRIPRNFGGFKSSAASQKPKKLQVNIPRTVFQEPSQTARGQHPLQPTQPSSLPAQFRPPIWSAGCRPRRHQNAELLARPRPCNPWIGFSGTLDNTMKNHI